MYGNLSGDDDPGREPSLTPEQRRALRSDLVSVAQRTRELLPCDYVVGSELTSSVRGPEATVAVQPPVGSVVSAGYAPSNGDDVSIGAEEREDLAVGLAASAALQVKQAFPEDGSPAAQ